MYIGIQAFYLVLTYYMFPETKGMTAEEASVVFDYGRTGIKPPIDPEILEMAQPKLGLEKAHDERVEDRGLEK